MALFGWLVLIAGIVLTVRFNVRVSAANEGHRLPVFFGQYAVPPDRGLRRTRRYGAVMVFYGILSTTGYFYEQGLWGFSVFYVIAMLLIVFSLPAGVTTLVHNGRPRLSKE